MGWVGCLLLGLLWVLERPIQIQAYPPAPYHTFQGIVRDEMGVPLEVTNAEVILETITGVRIQTTVIPFLGPGLNYRLRVPMDSGLTGTAYRPNALQPTVSFRIQVRIGSVTYLPMELSGGYANLGKAGYTTHLDLTLGVDSDGDGLPDAWKLALIAMLGGDLTLADIRPDDDLDGDGLTNMQEYIAGTYAWDPEDGLRLEVAGFSEENRPLLDFMIIRGRTYTVMASSDLKTWEPVVVRLATPAGPLADPSLHHVARDVRVVKAEVLTDEPEDASVRSFKLMVR